MKIALVHDWLTGFAGGEQVLLALHEMYPEAPIYTSLYRPEQTPEFDKATVIPSYLQRFSFLRNRHQLSIPLMPLAFESFDLKGFDVVVSIGGGVAKGIITQPDQRHITYCNTPMRYLWHIGGDNRASGSWLRSQAAHRLRIWDVVSADRVDHFLANSQTVSDRITKFYRKPSEVVFPPVNTHKFRLAEDKPGNYFLTVGRLIAYKRPDLIVEACIQTKSPLKVVGGGPEEASLKTLAKDAPWIEFLGRVPDSELEGLYQGAKAFLFAAEEDFGIVPVEAMSTGRPVIAYGRGGATETVEHGVSGILFKEQTAESLSEALADFESHTWDGQVIRKAAQRFDVEIFKKKMRKLIEG